MDHSNGIEGFHQDDSKKRKRLFFLLLIAVLAAYYIGVPYYQLTKAEQLLLRGEYENAAEIYSKYERYLIWNTKAKEGYHSAMENVAEKAVTDHDYDRAIDVFRDIGENDKAKEAQEEAAEYYFEKGDYQRAALLYEDIGNGIRTSVAWNKYGDALLESKEYEQAIDAYTQAQNDNKVQSAHLIWAEDLMEKKLYEEASQHYILAGRGDIAREIMVAEAERMISVGETDRIIEMLKPYKGTDIAELLLQAQRISYDDVKSEEAITSARKYGETIADPDMQLYYCRRLYESGYDLIKIYPDGVSVDMNLARYQIYNSDDSLEDEIPDYSKVIVFSRKEKTPDLAVETSLTVGSDGSSVDQRLDSRKRGDYEYSVKLHPELMLELLDDNQAWSLESCTSYVIMDEGYIPIGYISIRNIDLVEYESLISPLKSLSTYSSLAPLLAKNYGTTYKVLYYYAAYGAITVYDKKNPDLFENYDAYVDRPVAANAVVGNMLSELGVDLTGLQIEEIQAALNDKDSEESQEILGKYDPKEIELVEQNGWGDYILLPEKDELGNQNNFKGTSLNLSSWNVPKYMLGMPNETWIQEQLEDGAMTSLAFYFLFYGPDTNE